jgi:NAD(P)-dependent dehydrogenase (short-subunit alcohol dehydrogenase family)
MTSDQNPEVVIVTGSGSGIGQATAAAYLRRGATVAGFDVAAGQPAPPVDGDITGRWLPLQVDVSDGPAISAAAERVRSAYGRVDVLVNSAAIGFPDPIREITAERWDRVMAVNLKGAMLCIQAVLPTMLDAGRGNIVVLSSIAGRTKSVANGAHYTASKYALVGLVRHLAFELAGTGVRINCVCPGPTNTAFLDANSTPEERSAIVAATPLRRLGEAEDVANAVLFLAGEGSAHIHGAVLDVNGGMY